MSVRRRVCVRAGLLVAGGVGALALAVQLSGGTGDQPGDVTAAGVTQVDPASPVTDRPVTPPASGSTAPRADARTRLESGAVRAAAGTSTPAPVDESLPHTHVVDPRTGGLISVAGAVGAVGAPDDLGPMHVDPLPAGTDLSDPIDTGSLLERAGVAADSGSDTGSDTGSEPEAGTAETVATPSGASGVKQLGSHVTPSCSGTGTDGNRVQVLYAHEADTASRFSAVLPVLRQEVANVDDVFAVSARQTGGERRVRWVHDSECATTITSVTLPDGALGSDFWKTVDALKAKGYKAANRKYLVFADADELCGVGTVYDDRSTSGNANDGGYASYSRVDANCWSSSHSVPAHELTHNLGGVLANAPHATKNGHCFDEYDLMCYDDGSNMPMKKVCASAQEQLLDCNKDDYFNTNPASGSFLATNWNTARSSFLDVVATSAVRPTVTVTASSTTPRTGDLVTLTGTSSASATWAWSTSSNATACTLTPGAGTASTTAQATLRCPASVTGTVTVTGTATQVGTGATGSGSGSLSVTRAPVPAVAVTAPSGAVAGTDFTVGATPTGTGPFDYSWTAGSCTLASPKAASTSVSCPAGTLTQSLPVRVVLTQADGQEITGERLVALTGRPVPTVTTWTSPRFADGVLAASLRDVSSAPLAGTPVSLQVRWSGSTRWSTLVPAERLRTDAAGRAGVRPPRDRAGSFRLAWAGDETHAASTSGSVALKAQTRARARTQSRGRVVGSLRTPSGSRVAGATLVLQRRVAGSTRWTNVTRARTDRSGDVSRRVRPTRTTYYRWVFRGESGYLGSLSTQVRLRR